MTTKLEAALAHADAHLDQSLERLKTLVSIKSISTDPAYAGEVRKAADWLAADLAALGFDASVRPTPGHPVVVAHDGDTGPHVLFYAHYDVQPVDPLNLWHTDPFVATPIKGEDGQAETSLVLCDPAASLMDAYKARVKQTEETVAKARADAEPKARAAGMGQNQAPALTVLAEILRDERLADEAVLRRELQDRGMEKSAAWYAIRTLIKSGAIVKVGEILRLPDEEER